MELEKFRVTNYRNIWDSGWIFVNKLTAFVGPNESGKSNLFEALYCLNPMIEGTTYDLEEDWPVDQWEKKHEGKGKTVCEAEFVLDRSEIMELYDRARPKEEAEKADGSAAAEASTGLVVPPEEIRINVSRAYGKERVIRLVGAGDSDLEKGRAEKWVAGKLPKLVYIRDYEMSGDSIEIDGLQNRLKNEAQNNRHKLSNEDRTLLIVLDLSGIEFDDFVQKGGSPEGRTLRSFDKRLASGYLTQQFQNLWSQKDVKFDIEIDGTTLNIFAEDSGIGMPVRLHRRSTGFRWYVSFAWKFTHASGGEFKNCILLLEEPGIHLHYTGQKDLLRVFERLADANTILYTTHLASMVDPANPEHVRIVESHDHHVSITHGVVSSQKAPMAVIERCLGLTGDLGGMLGHRQVFIVEGGSDALILYKLSGLMSAAGKVGLPDRVYLWPAGKASNTPMYAAFAIGQKWDAGVLLDSDAAGNAAREKLRISD